MINELFDFQVIVHCEYMEQKQAQVLPVTLLYLKKQIFTDSSTILFRDKII